MADRWTCPVCRKRYVVISLAEMCASKHERTNARDSNEKR